MENGAKGRVDKSEYHPSNGPSSPIFVDPKDFTSLDTQKSLENGRKTPDQSFGVERSGLVNRGDGWVLVEVFR